MLGVLEVVVFEYKLNTETNLSVNFISKASVPKI
jgi:hypothetical protein